MSLAANEPEAQRIMDEYREDFHHALTNGLPIKPTGGSWTAGDVYALHRVTCDMLHHIAEQYTVLDVGIEMLVVDDDDE